MAYVRQRGNQLAIVHGVRDPETKKVEQQILFTIYSRAEALAALGKSDPASADRFRSLLERSHPGVHFDWKALHRGISEQLAILPERYDYAATRVRGQFHDELLAFARQLILADPSGLAASSQLLSAHRGELLYLRELIDRRLAAPERKVNEWSADNDFFWRFATRGLSVPEGIEEHAAHLYEQRDFPRAIAAFKLLTDAFEDYAEGHNYLGLIALDQQRLDDAIGHFKKSMEVGRRLFPKKIAKSRWWSDLATRPYMRGLRNLALTLNQAKRYDEALGACELLHEECGDALTAASTRSSVYLNTARWQEAHDAARFLHQVSPAESLVAAFAAFELGKPDDARAYFTHASLDCPTAVAMVIGERTRRPTDNDEIRDHNTGVSLLRALAGYLARRKADARRYFSELWKSEAQARLRAEMAAVSARWKADRKGKDRAAFERMTELGTWEFALEFVRPVSSAPHARPSHARRSPPRVVH